MAFLTGTISTVADASSSNQRNLDAIGSDALHSMTRTTDAQNNMNNNVNNYASDLSNDMDNYLNRAQSIPQFESTTKNIHLLYQLISSIQSFGDFCLLDISNEGMCFSINDGNICKIRLNLNKKVFSTYTFNGVWKDKLSFRESHLYAEETDLSDNSSDEDNEDNQKGILNNTSNYITNGFDPDGVISINLNISSFLETINIHVKDRKFSDQEIDCTFRFHRNGDPFIMIFEDELIVERCELNTYYIDSPDLTKRKSRKGKKKGKISESQTEANEEALLDNFETENPIIDDSIFRLNSKKVLYEVILKSYILHDIIKDMNDLNTDKFIIYCKKIKKTSDSRNYNNHDREDKDSKLIFISKSKSDTIGFSKLIVPQRKLNVPEFKLFKPVKSNNNSDEVEFQDCYNLSLTSTYHFDYFSRLLRAIRLSKLIKIRKDMDGITSLLLLLGKSPNTQKQNNQPPQLDYNELYGSSIEFVTLESISIDELSALSLATRNNTFLSNLGYNNIFVEKLIKDDHDIQTVRVGNNGQLITLDDYFGDDAKAQFDEIENNLHARDGLQNLEIENIQEGNFENDNDFIPIETISSKKPPQEVHNDSNVLHLTEQLTMSLLGHSAPIEVGRNNIEVEQTMIENDPDEGTTGRRKRVSNFRNDHNKKAKNGKGRIKNGKKNNNSKKKNDGIETVGGAIEIPLFI